MVTNLRKTSTPEVRCLIYKGVEMSRQSKVSAEGRQLN
jgi:hypothetical protein